MKVLFIYPETYLNVGIPGGIAIMSALLKQRNHQVDLFDTAFLKTKDYNQTTEDVHGGTGLSDKGGVSVFKKTVLIRSALFIIVYILMIKSNASVITAIPLVLLLIMIYSISSLSLRENIEELNNSLTNIHDVDNIK